MEIDLHGFHPTEINVIDLVRQAWETGAEKLTLIHGYGRHSKRRGGFFVNTNTGPLGLEVRRQLRNGGELKEWAIVSSLDCSMPGTTSIRLRSNANVSRLEIDLPEPRMFEHREMKW